MWYHRYLSQSDIQKIEAAIAQAELKTSGEIVPVVVRRSSAIGHIPLLLTLSLIFQVSLICAIFWPQVFVAPFVYIWPLIWVGIYILSALLTRLKAVQRFFVPNADEVWQAFQRAKLEFYENKIYRTEEGTGILIFVSVMERQALILADKGISDKLPPETWEKLLNKFRASLRKGCWSEAFLEAIHECGEILQPHFPIRPGDVNELQNHLVIKDN